MKFPTRRTVLTAAATMGAAAVASAQEGDEPVLGHKGAPIMGPRNREREQENPDLLRPPPTDHGSIPNPYETARRRLVA
jgi:oxalate decarboxylase